MRHMLLENELKWQFSYNYYSTIKFDPRFFSTNTDGHSPKHVSGLSGSSGGLAK